MTKTKSRISLLVVLPLGLNMPGLLALAGKLYEPLSIVTLVALPVVVLWGLPGLLFCGELRDAFQVTEFGIYPQTTTGWLVLFSYWGAIGLAIALSAARVKAKRRT